MARGPDDPRVRYIALRVDGDPALTRRELIEAIKAAGRQAHGPGFEQETGIWLTRFKGNEALVRCHHTHQAVVRQVLEQVTHDPQNKPLGLRSLGASGTIRKLVETHVPGLKESESERREKRKAAKNANGRGPVRKNGSPPMRRGPQNSDRRRDPR